MPPLRDQPRAVAARMVDAVINAHRSSDQVLTRLPGDPLSRELFYGTLRHFFTLAEAVTAALTRPVRKKDHDIWCLLLVGAYQLHHTRIPDHAAINETVGACRVLGKPWATGLVNGVLRTIQRRGRPGPETERSVESPERDFPAWMVDLLRRDYGADVDELLIANLGRAPATLRINRLRTTPAGYRALLDAAGMDHAPAFRDEFVTLAEPVGAEHLPGFDTGLVAIQDAGAGFAEGLLPATPAARVLDACAAPGGKLFHLMECRPEVRAFAIDRSPVRMQRLREEAHRLGHAPTTLVGDATDRSWWDGEPFDAVLVDAPCSGSGTLRRHPDIKILRSRADLAGHAQLQRRLLSNLWRTLRPGGSLLYCTCSLFAEENDAVIAEFLATTGSAQVQKISLPTGIPREFGWQLLPTESRTDGFYYSLIANVGNE